MRETYFPSITAQVTNAPRSVTEHKLPKPLMAVCVMVSAHGSTHMTPRNDYYTADQLREEVAKAELRGREAMRQEWLCRDDGAVEWRDVPVGEEA